ncbi:DUF2946 domain-containing protein [Derxia gummosa]|uniref:DUF2946 domain-containing protein n=1 Tax=Derxia gummosa DSM 723 TaxID=1121388 RepID=A0A8B6X3R0_9BURK|nr:DUF2946 domain-containing protein [Derxia gummosa]
MRFPAALHRLASWLALAAMLFGALAPAISHAIAADGHDGWVRICSAGAVKWLPAEAVPPEQRSPASQHAPTLDHCPFCALHADLLPPAPDADSRLTTPAMHEAPTAFLRAPRTLHAWASAQPRAPPRRG